MSSKMDQLIQRTPTGQVGESYTPCGQSSCQMENAINTAYFTLKDSMANKLNYTGCQASYLCRGDRNTLKQRTGNEFPLF